MCSTLCESTPDRAAVASVGLIEPSAAFLAADPVETAYLAGVQEQPYCQFATWVGSPAVRPETVAVFYEIAEPAIAFCYGQESGTATIFGSANSLPPSLYAVGARGHLDELERWYRFDSVQEMQRMVLRHDAPLPPDSPDAAPLCPEDLSEILALLGSQGMRLDVMQLNHGNYWGVRADGKLASVVGAHFVSEGSSLAFVGNVVTAPGFQRRGYASAALVGLLRQLRNSAGTICLDVEVENQAAVKLYETLGFAPHSRHFESLGRRKT